MALEELTEKLQKEHFRIALINGDSPHFPELAKTLLHKGYAVGEAPRPYLPSSFYEPAFAQQTSRTRKVALAQALAPYARGILGQEPDACVINYPDLSDEREALTAALVVFLPQYQRTTAVVIPFLHVDEASVLSAVRVAHGVSFYCSDLAAFLDALTSVYPQQDDEPRALFSHSVRILTDLQYPQEQKYELLEQLLRSLSSLLEEPEHIPRFAPAAEQIVTELCFRIHGLYSILYEKPLPDVIYS